MLFQSHKPVWLYESLPVIYLLTGLLSIAAGEHAFATISGLLLISASALVFKMRYDHRRA